MRFVSLLALLVLTVACGGSGGGSKSDAPQEQQQTPVNTNGEAPDQIETMIDPNVSVTANDIVFTTTQVRNTQGKSINCSLSVNEGEVYRYHITGDSMEVLTRRGTFTMTRDYPGTGAGAIGSKWNYRGTEAGADVRMMLFVVNDKKVIMRKWCEQI